MKRPLSHSRYLDYGARDIGDRAVQQARSTPTAKQVRFFKRLCVMCRENGIDTAIGHGTRTRADMAMAIDKLLARLQEAGIDVNGNGKSAEYVLTVGSDRRGRYYVDEKIRVDEAGEKEESYDQLRDN